GHCHKTRPLPPKQFQAKTYISEHFAKDLEATKSYHSVQKKNSLQNHNGTLPLPNRRLGSALPSMKYFFIADPKIPNNSLPEKEIKLAELKHCLFHVKVLPTQGAIKRKATS
ncbi:MAG: hypothetical protein LBP81_06790, partial [Treponema sp.]|nr:hypothetical protein [Treponema sp.]